MYMKCLLVKSRLE